MTATATAAPQADEHAASARPGFRLSLENFDGPFDLLLHLISQRQLDITEVALAEVTDEFIAYLKALRSNDAAGGGLKLLDETTEFLVVASTLLDLKAARLLPRGELADDEDLDLLEARDLLFARLLQYKAFKQAAGWLEERYQEESAHVPREVPLEKQFAALLPELIITATPEDLARFARQALEPKVQAEPSVSVSHLHGADVNLADEAAALAAKLRGRAEAQFTELIGDATSQLVVVVRFLALLEMFRQRVIVFEQESALGPLLVKWRETEQEFDAEALEDEYEAIGK